MNASLPAGIESYLKEAGFSVTEMLVLRKLLEEESLTIRELASKTGKSTGVLDQAMKKLLAKRIVVKGTINGQPRYSIQSLDTIVSWVKQDMQERKTMLERRHQNFESFISSLKLDRARPDIEHFSGKEGITQAYLRLVDMGQELLTITPIFTNIEDDPLRSLRVDLFRKRQARKIFQRVIAPDTPLARRFQSRDPFEYRKTILVPEAELPVSFEKIICGSIVACFNHAEETACFLKYPELANAERAGFEVLWQRQNNNHQQIDQKTGGLSVAAQIPLKTRLLSSFREFILSPKSIAALVLFALMAGALTFGLYKSNRDLNIARIQEKVIAIAATAALQFDEKEINAIRLPTDIVKPEYATLVSRLNLVRRSNRKIQYAYIFRKTENPSVLHFVADADSLIPSEKKDLNGDSIVDEKDTLLTPGDPYSAFASPSLLDGFKMPTSDFGQDQWGSFISGYAPIKDRNGKSIALLGFDIFESELDNMSAESFSPLYAFTLIFLFFLAARFFAMNRSLVRECFVVSSKHKRKAMGFIGLSFLIFVILAHVIIFSIDRIQVKNTGIRLLAVVSTAVGNFVSFDFSALRFARDMQKESYQSIFNQLNNIRNQNPEISYVYILRKNIESPVFEFVADADSNINLPSYSKYSIFDESPLGEFDENIWPGVAYDASLNAVYEKSLTLPAYGEIFDQWGYAITACAPILKFDKEALILCADKKADIK